MGKYVVYRTSLNGLYYLQESNWDRWCDGEPERMVREVSRGHTLVDAINLTQLVNEQQEKEDEI